MRAHLAPCLGLALLACAPLCGAPIAAAEPNVAAPPRMLPARLLRCVLGRMTNVDPSRPQTADEIVYEGHHPFELFLPAIPMRTTPPPDATEPPEPVNPATRIVTDPDRLVAGAPRGFLRVVDEWPDRVELTSPVDGPLVNLIIVNPIDPLARTATLFMTRATDITSYDLAHIYQGKCEIRLVPKR